MRIQLESFRRMIHEMPDPVSVNELPGGAYVEVNEAWSRFSGYSRSEAIGKSAVRLGLWANRDQLERFLRALEDTGAVQSFPADFRVRDGIRHGSISAMILDVDGKSSVVSWTRDVTEQRRAEEALRESEERFRSLAAFSPVGIFLTDAAGEALYTNKRWEEITGYTSEEARGGGWRRAVHPDDREMVVQKWQRCVAEGRELALEFRCRTPEGVVRWLRARAAAVRLPNGEIRGYVGTSEDITEKKRIEEVRRDFVRMLSHDIKNPLAAILGFAEIMRDEAPENATLREAIDAIESNAHQAVAIALNFLDADRIESGALEVSRAPASVNRIVEHVLRHQSARARRHRVTLRADLARALPTIDIDEPLVDRAIANLVNNAIKFSPEGGTVTVATKSSPPDVRIEVRDEGPGVSAEARAKIFERYVRGSATRRDSTGLGLFIVRTIAEAHGGRVSLDCPPAGGSVFTLTLPRAGT